MLPADPDRVESQLTELKLFATVEQRSDRLRVTLYEPAGRGGICHYTHQLGEHLARAGVDVTLITTEDYELKQLEHHFKINYLFTRSWVTRLRQRVPWIRRNAREGGNQGHRGQASAERITTVRQMTREGIHRSSLRRLRIRLLHLRTLCHFLWGRPDLVHFQWLVSRRQDREFIKRLRQLGIPAIYTAHDVEPHITASQEDRADLQRLYDSVAKIIVHAESNKRELLSLFDVEASKVAVIPHGSYDFLCASETLSKAAARRKVGVPEGKKVILFFGLIKRYKGLEYLVAAFEKVRGSVNDAFLLIVGEIYAGDVEGHRYYSRLIEGLRDRDDVLCVASYVPFETVGDYLAAADVVVLPYTRTYQSGVLLAAYAAGRPVVVTDTGGLSEVVEGGKSGFVVPPRDVKALADGIVNVVGDPERLDAMGKHARYMATTVYAWDAIASRTIELYQSVVGKRRGVLRNGPTGGVGASVRAVGEAENGEAARRAGLTCEAARADPPVVRRQARRLRRGQILILARLP